MIEELSYDSAGIEGDFCAHCVRAWSGSQTKNARLETVDWLIHRQYGTDLAESSCRVCTENDR
jgi:hypothetical protein